MIHLTFCNVVRKFGSRTKNMNRHRFVAFPTKDRGFPFLSGPVCTTTKREFDVKINFFVFAILFASETNEIIRITRNVWKLTDFTFSSSGVL